MADIQIKNLTFTYPGKDTPALVDVSLSVPQGAYITLCGRSGSGKTSLLRQLKSVLAPHGIRTGEILYDGIPLDRIPLDKQAAQIGYVMQNPEEQIVTDKVWSELAFGLENLGIDPTTMRTRVAEMACYFGIQDWFHKDVSTLSGGQKQLLNLAGIMAMQPQVLILDEPTSQLDPLAASDFLNTVRKINLELGTTVIITEHRLEDILPYADQVVVMEQGQVIACDTPQKVSKYLWELEHPMFSAMPTPAQVYYRSGYKDLPPLTVRHGRQWLQQACPTPNITQMPQEEPVHTAPALELKNLWFRYERNTPDILKGVTGSIPAGSLFAVVGGNGAGKSTLLKAICGSCRAYRGKTTVLGKTLEQYKHKELFRGIMAMLPQDPKSLFVKDSVKEDLGETAQDEASLMEIAKLCQVDLLLNAHPYDLSGGEQQRVALAKLLLTNPKILLLDEPTKGMDNFFKSALGELLRKLTEQGITIIMVSHDVEFCAQYADHVSMFFDGQLLATNSPKQFFGGNSFYTTAANRMSRAQFQNAVNATDIVQLLRANREETV